MEYTKKKFSNDILDYYCFESTLIPEYTNGYERKLLKDPKKKKRWDFFYRVNSFMVGLPQKEQIAELNTRISSIDENISTLESSISSSKGWRIFQFVLLTISIFIGFYILQENEDAIIVPIALGIFALIGIVVTSSNINSKQEDIRKHHNSQNELKQYIEEYNSQINALAEQAPKAITGHEMNMIIRKDLEAIQETALLDLGIKNKTIELDKELSQGFSGILILTPAFVQNERRAGKSELLSRQYPHLDTIHIDVNGMIYYATLYVQFIFFTSDQIIVSGCFWDLIDIDKYGNDTREVYYSDITCIETRSEREEFTFGKQAQKRSLILDEKQTDADKNNGSRYELYLCSLGDERIQLYKALRELLDIELKEVIELVKDIPCLLEKYTSIEEAEAAANALTDAGASVDVKPMFTLEQGSTTDRQTDEDIPRIETTSFSLSIPGTSIPITIAISDEVYTQNIRAIVDTVEKKKKLILKEQNRKSKKENINQEIDQMFNTESSINIDLNRNTSLNKEETKIREVDAILESFIRPKTRALAAIKIIRKEIRDRKTFNHIGVEDYDIK